MQFKLLLMMIVLRSIRYLEICYLHPKTYSDNYLRFKQFG